MGQWLGGWIRSGRGQNQWHQFLLYPKTPFLGLICLYSSTWICASNFAATGANPWVSFQHLKIPNGTQHSLFQCHYIAAWGFSLDWAACSLLEHIRLLGQWGAKDWYQSWWCEQYQSRWTLILTWYKTAPQLTYYFKRCRTLDAVL